MGRSIQWTEDMRTVLMLLRTQTKFKGDRLKVAAVFNRMFAAELKENGYSGGMDPKRITDTWNSRGMEGRSKSWLTVDDPPKNAKERRHREKLFKEIKKVAAEIDGPGDDEEDASSSSEEEKPVKRRKLRASPMVVVEQAARSSTRPIRKATTSVNGEGKTGQSKHVNSDKEGVNSDANMPMMRTRNWDKSNMKANTNRKHEDTHNTPNLPVATPTGDSPTTNNLEDSRRRSTRHKMSEPQPPPIPESNGEQPSSKSPPPLPMIHSNDKLAFDKDNTPIPPSAFVNEDKPVFSLGARVYNLPINHKSQDVQVCNRRLCKRCYKKTIPPTTSPTQGLPFCHATDLEVVKGVGHKFRQVHREYDNKIPAELWKTRVTFSDDVKREVRVCVAAKCEYCSGKEEVEKKAARYLPGGYLYALKMEMENAKKSIEGNGGA